MAFSTVGKFKTVANVVLFLVNIVVLALAARVNHFQNFFFVADLFPFGLSIATFVLLSVMITLDFAITDSYTGRAQFEAGLLGVLSIFWLAFNSFSTSRWQQIPLHCDTIPDDFADERVWCRDVQALKGLVWVEFVFCFVTSLIIFRYAITQYKRGYKHIFKVPLSRYRPELGRNRDVNDVRDGNSLRFRKMM